MGKKSYDYKDSRAVHADIISKDSTGSKLSDSKFERAVEHATNAAAEGKGVEYGTLASNAIASVSNEGK